jgi:hypothetical protein
MFNILVSIDSLSLKIKLSIIFIKNTSLLC